METSSSLSVLAEFERPTCAHDGYVTVHKGLDDTRYAWDAEYMASSTVRSVIVLLLAVMDLVEARAELRSSKHLQPCTRGHRALSWLSAANIAQHVPRATMHTASLIYCQGFPTRGLRGRDYVAKSPGMRDPAGRLALYVDVDVPCTCTPLPLCWRELERKASAR